jgi:uncharacterized membrane protein YjjP (DUF1212 family)
MRVEDMQDVAVKSTSAEEAAHLSLELGRLLLTNGADTEQVHDSVARLAAALDFQAHLIISHEALLVTVDVKKTWHTRVGRHVPPTVVDMTVVETLIQIPDETVGQSLDCSSAHARLAALEQNKPLYPHWLIA